MAFETEKANTDAIEEVIREVKLWMSRAFNDFPQYNNCTVHEVIEHTPEGHEWMYWRETQSVYMAKQWTDIQGLGIMGRSFKELVWRVAYRQIIVEQNEFIAENGSL